jgi:hypothetical protein
MPAYLESSNPANTALYQRFGFERLGVIRVGRSRTHGPHAAHRTMIDVEGWVQRKTQLLAQYNRAALVEANEVKDVLVSPTWPATGFSGQNTPCQAYTAARS